MSIQGQVHFLTLAQGNFHIRIKTCFYQKPLDILFRLRPWDVLDLFYGKVKFCNLGFYTGKGNTDGIFLQHVAWKLVDIVNLMSIKMKVYEVPLTLVEQDSDSKIKACTQNSFSHL